MKQATEVNPQLKAIKLYAVLAMLGNIGFVFAGAISKIGHKSYANELIFVGLLSFVAFIGLLAHYFSIRKRVER